VEGQKAVTEGDHTTERLFGHNLLPNNEVRPVGGTKTSERKTISTFTEGIYQFLKFQHLLRFTILTVDLRANGVLDNLEQGVDYRKRFNFFNQKLGGECSVVNKLFDVRFLRCQ
jgi:hypothetical protein